MQALVPGLSIIQMEDSDDTRISARISTCGSHVFMRWHVHAKCMFHGPRMGDGLPLGFITHDDEKQLKDAWTQGDYMAPGCVAGTRFSRQEMYLCIPARTTMHNAVISQASFDKAIQTIGGNDLRAKLDKINIALPSPVYWDRFQQATIYRLLNPDPDLDNRLEDQLVLLVSEMLDDAFSTDGFIPSPRSRWDIQKAVIDYTTALGPGVAPKVKDLTAALRFSDDTLIRACKEKFGLKPLDLMRFICLEQARVPDSTAGIESIEGLESDR